MGDRLDFRPGIGHADRNADILHAGHVVDIVSHIAHAGRIDLFLLENSFQSLPLVQVALKTLDLELLASLGNHRVGLSGEHDAVDPVAAQIGDPQPIRAIAKDILAPVRTHEDPVVSKNPVEIKNQKTNLL